MKTRTRILGAVLCSLTLCACFGSTTDEAKPWQPRLTSCNIPGEHCRWDKQCCSGRCYVDTGCGG